jgi:capsule polysaccharide export protein KpsE/RkpR
MQTMRPELGALAGLAAIPDGNDRFIALLKSRVVADRIISRFSLMRLYSTRYRHEARTALAKHTTIQEDRKSGVITLIFSDRSPELAAQIAQAYVRELERLNAELNTSGAHLERQFLEERVKEVDQQLHEATSRLSDFSTSSGMLDPQQQPKTTVDEALKLEAQIVSLKAELSGQEQIYSPETLRVPRARLAELEQHLAQLQGTHAARPLDGLDGSFPSIRKLPKSSAAFLEFSRQVKLLEAVQMYLTQKLELAKTEEVKQLPAVRVMEPAEIPEQRVWPKRTEIVLAAFTFGLFAAATLVFGKAKWQATEADHPMKALLIDALGRNSTSLRQFGA